MKTDTTHTKEELDIIYECWHCKGRCKDLRTHILICRQDQDTEADATLLFHIREVKNGRKSK